MKCRAKRKDNGKWIYGYYVFTYNCCYIIANEYFLVDEDYCAKEFIEVQPDTVCIVVGLPDKNGTPIYEQDIIDEAIAIRWNNDNASFEFFWTFNGETCNGDINWDEAKYFLSNKQILGNTFDNKELLNP